MEIKSLIDPEGGLVDRRISPTARSTSWSASASSRAVGSTSATERDPNTGDFAAAIWAKSRSSCGVI